MRTHLLVLAAALLLAPALAAAQSPGPFGRWKGAHVPGQVLVKFRPAATATARAAAVRAAGHAVLGEVERSRWVQVKTAPGESLEQALAAYGADPDVEWAQPNYVYRTAVAPDDPGYGFLWAFQNTGQNVDTLVTPLSDGAPTQPPGQGAPYSPSAGTSGDDMSLEAAWNVTTDCSGTVVAVADTGVNYTHVDLAANMWDGGASFPNHGRNFVGTSAGDSATMDLNGHGTHVAGTIGAVGNNGIGVAGVCWKARIMIVRILGADGLGDSVSLMSGVTWAATHGAKVINLSLVGYGGFDQAYSDAIGVAQDNDAVLVVAAGNDSVNTDGGGTHVDGTGAAVPNAAFPCNFTLPNIVCVAALDQTYALASFSNWGPTSVDVGAPGTNIVSTWPGDTSARSLSSGWTFNPVSGGWAYKTLTVGGRSTASVVVPSSFPNGSYGANADLLTWTSFPLPAGALGATLELKGALGLYANGRDALRIAWAPGTGNPFSSGSVNCATEVNCLVYTSAYNTLPYVVSMPPIDISSCLSGPGTCAVGFELVTYGAGTGAAITDMDVSVIATDAAAYNTLDGTSMATPNTTGVVTLLRAYNPLFTYADAIEALERGGPPALTGLTSTGRAVDAMGSLRYVRPPRPHTAATNAVVSIP